MRRQIVLQPGTRTVRLGGRPPRAVTGILVALVVLLLLYAFADGPAWVAAWLGVSGETTLLHKRIYQPLTALWIHLVPLDLVFSGLVIWLAGGALERFWGRRRLLLFFTATGAGGLLCGAAVSLLHDPRVVLSGTAGAAVGLLVALALVFPRHLPFMYGGVLPLKARPLALILAGFLVVGSLTGGRYLQVAVQLGGGLCALPFLLRGGRPGGSVGGGAGAGRGRRRLGVVDGGKADKKEPKVWN